MIDYKIYECITNRVQRKILPSHPLHPQRGCFRAISLCIKFQKIHPFCYALKIYLLVLCLMGGGCLYAQQQHTHLQRDLTSYVEHITGQTDPEHFDDHDHELWHYYLSRPHPNVSTINSYFEEAAEEFGVPAPLLKVIGQVENNWTQIGPSIDKGWGIMHLVQNKQVNTLGAAAELLNVSEQVLKDDPRQNIRGAAALLAAYARPDVVGDPDLHLWYEAAKKFSGLAQETYRTMQADTYYQRLKTGNTSQNVWAETIQIEARPELEYFVEIRRLYTTSNRMASSDYGPAISDLTSCNYGTGRNSAINTWVNHWIGVGTYAGAISWFHTCRPSAPSSAHFVIRSSDGEITQVVAVANTAYHAGASGYNNNGPSIGIEHEATAANPGLWNSVPMLEASTTMACYFTGIYNIPPTRSLPGIREHNEMPGTSTDCAGSIPWTTWMDMYTGCVNGCPPSDIISSNSLPSGTYSAENYIESNATIPNGSTVNFEAGNYIDLQPGFEGVSGSVFDGYIAPCSNLTTTDEERKGSENDRKSSDQKN